MSTRTAIDVAEQRRRDEHGPKQPCSDARTHDAWMDAPVDDALLRGLNELAQLEEACRMD